MTLPRIAFEFNHNSFRLSDSPHHVNNIAGIQGPQLDANLLDNLAGLIRFRIRGLSAISKLQQHMSLMTCRQLGSCLRRVEGQKAGGGLLYLTLSGRHIELVEGSLLAFAVFSHH